MSRKQERTKQAPKILDGVSRARQLRHHLESLERDNFVALNEYEAIIATAAAAASAPGPLSHDFKNPIQDIEASGFGSIVGGVIGTAGPGVGATAGAVVSQPTGRSKNKKKGAPGSAAGTGTTGTTAEDTVGASSSSGYHTHRKPALPKKPLHVLLEDSGIADFGPDMPSYLNANMGPSRYPSRQFCSVCGWKGTYRCNKCGMRYCDLRCQKTHEETRCMKFMI